MFIDNIYKLYGKSKEPVFYRVLKTKSRNPVEKIASVIFDEEVRKLMREHYKLRKGDMVITRDGEIGEIIRFKPKVTRTRIIPMAVIQTDSGKIERKLVDLLPYDKNEKYRPKYGCVVEEIEGIGKEAVCAPGTGIIHMFEPERKAHEQTTNVFILPERKSSLVDILKKVKSKTKRFTYRSFSATTMQELYETILAMRKTAEPVKASGMVRVKSDNKEKLSELNVGDTIEYEGIPAKVIEKRINEIVIETWDGKKMTIKTR